MAFCCFSCCCYRDPPQATTPRCHHCCHCLIRGSSGGAGVAACGGGSGSSSSGGSGGGSKGGGGGGGSGAFSSSYVVILLLFARPPCQHHPSPFRCPLLFPLAAARTPSAHKGWLLFGLVYCPLCCPRRPVIVDDVDVTLVLPAASAFVALSGSCCCLGGLWSRCSHPRHHRHRGRRRGLSVGTKP